MLLTLLIAHHAAGDAFGRQEGAAQLIEAAASSCPFLAPPSTGAAAAGQAAPPVEGAVLGHCAATGTAARTAPTTVTHANWGMRAWVLNWACSMHAANRTGRYLVYAMDGRLLAFLRARGVPALLHTQLDPDPRHRVPEEHVGFTLDGTKGAWHDLMVAKFPIVEHFVRCGAPVLYVDADVTVMADVGPEVFGLCKERRGADDGHLGNTVEHTDFFMKHDYRSGKRGTEHALSLAFMFDKPHPTWIEKRPYIDANAGYFVACPTAYAAVVLARAQKDRDGYNEQFWLQNAIGALVAEGAVPPAQVALLNHTRWVNGCPGDGEDPPSLYHQDGRHGVVFHPNCCANFACKMCKLRGWSWETKSDGSAGPAPNHWICDAARAAAAANKDGKGTCHDWVEEVDKQRRTPPGVLVASQEQRWGENLEGWLAMLDQLPPTTDIARLQWPCEDNAEFHADLGGIRHALTGRYDGR